MKTKKAEEKQNWMKFRIVSGGKVIAAFLNESDRDLCLTLFEEVYEDVVFEAKEDK